MNRLKLQDLFDAARSEGAPSVDVADTVMASLAARRHATSAVLNRSLLWMSMGSSAVAAAVMVAAYVAWHGSGSVNEILKMVAWVAQ